MGIPGILPWIQRSFPHCYENLVGGVNRKAVDIVHIDANSLIYDAIEVVYSPNQTTLNIYAELSPSQKALKIYELFWEGIEILLSIVVPKKILFIAIDGPAPVAKQNQQRWRRFKNDFDPLVDIEKDERFNTSQITPGTPFMHNLMKYINYVIRREMASKTPYSNVSWKRIKVIFSPCSIPGEGEHKCLDYIKHYRKHISPDDSHCIIGNDNDLIMLGLASYVKNMFLLKKEMHKPNTYIFMNMRKIAEEFPKTFRQPERSVEDCINDFIVGAFFVGNDFLPMIPMFENLREGLKKTISTYSFISNKNKIHLSKKGRVDIGGLKAFLFEMKKSEQHFLLERFINSVKNTPELKFIDHTMRKHIEKVSDQKYQLHFPNYRRDYYKKAGVDCNNPSQLKKMCMDYLKSLIWVFDYYVHTLPSWTWAYNYHYAPLMVDFFQYVNALKPDEIKQIFHFEKGEPSLPFEQLLNVFPAKFSYLLPKPYAKLMTDISSPLVQSGYYPSSFSIDYEGKRKEYEGLALIPFVDWRAVRLCYNEVTEKLHHPERYHRNVGGSYKKPPVHFYVFSVREMEPPKSYTSPYGSISYMKIRKDVITG